MRAKIGNGVGALLLGALALVGCRTDAKGLMDPTALPPPHVERPDVAPGSSPTTEAGVPPAMTAPPPAMTAPPPTVVEGRADAAAAPADAASTPADAALVPPAPPAPIADAAMGAPEAAGPAPTWLGPMVRAKEIRADTVKAQIIYAKEVEAEEARVDMVTETKDDKRWEMGGSDTKLDVQSLLAEVIYVEKLRCRRVEARELHAEVLKIERR